MFPRILYFLIPLFIIGVIASTLSLIDMGLTIFGGPGYIQRLTRIDIDAFFIASEFLLGITFTWIILVIIRRKLGGGHAQRHHDKDR